MFTLNNTSLAAPGALAHRLQCRTACKIQNCCSEAHNGRQGLERFLGAPVNFLLISFFDPNIPFTRKGRNGEKKMGKKWNGMTFIVATNVVASQPPKRQPTGTPTARANRAFGEVYWCFNAVSRLFQGNERERSRKRKRLLIKYLWLDTLTL